MTSFKDLDVEIENDTEKSLIKVKNFCRKIFCLGKKSETINEIDPYAY